MGITLCTSKHETEVTIYAVGISTSLWQLHRQDPADFVAKLLFNHRKQQCTIVSIQSSYSRDLHPEFSRQHPNLTTVMRIIATVCLRAGISSAVLQDVSHICPVGVSPWPLHLERDVVLPLWRILHGMASVYCDFGFRYVRPLSSTATNAATMLVHDSLLPWLQLCHERLKTIEQQDPVYAVAFRRTLQLLTTCAVDASITSFTDGLNLADFLLLQQVVSFLHHGLPWNQQPLGFQDVCSAVWYHGKRPSSNIFWIGW